MGAELLNISIFNENTFYSFYKEFESSIKNANELNIKNISKQLLSFCLSDKFIPFLFTELGLCEKESFKSFSRFIGLYESKEKYLSLKILFNLLEDLKNAQFDIQLKEILSELKKDSKQLKWFYEKYSSYIQNNMEFYKNIFLPENIEKYKLPEFEEFMKGNEKYIKSLLKIYFIIVVFTFNDSFYEFDKSEKLTDGVLRYISECDEETAQNLIKNLQDFNSLNHTINSYQLILFILELKMNLKEISLREKDGKIFFKDYINRNYMDYKIIWKLYKEEELNSSKSEKKYIKTIIEGKITEKEKFKFDLFDFINQIKVNEYIKGIDGAIFRSIFDINRLILIIKFDLDSFKNQKITLDQIEKQIKLIKSNNYSHSNNLDTYAQIENTIINLDSSYDLFVLELKAKKIIDQNEMISNGSKDKIKTLEEKIKKLEEELKEEKNKNKNNDNENLINSLENETKDSLIKLIIKKEKENKELKLKLSRLPFTLESGEKLMTVNFISSEPKLYFSVICKNTDEFFKVEQQLYKSHPELSKNGVNFTLKGEQINRFKTLEKNDIKNNDVICLN